MKHGMHKHKLYSVWGTMKQRCNNPKDAAYDYYGGRGIGYHPSFETFEGFLAGIPDGYEDGLTLDRIDNDGNYEPGNLRWATRLEQAGNRRGSAIFEHDGQRKVLRAIAEEVGLTKKAIEGRMTRGKSLEEALLPATSGRPAIPVDALPMLGKRFGLITVEDYSHEEGRNLKYYHCVCDCGERKVIRGSSLTSGKTTSCGCVQRAAVRASARRKSLASIGLTETQIAKLKRDLWHHSVKEVATLWNVPQYMVDRINRGELFGDIDEYE